MIITETRHNLFVAQICYGSSSSSGGSGSSSNKSLNSGAKKSLKDAGGNIMDNMQKNGANMKFKDSLLGRAWNYMTKDPRSSKNFGH